MLSNKWTFSLTSLVIMLSLAFIASSALAQFEIKLSVGSDEDVSFADGNQVVYGAATTINIMSTKVISRASAASVDTTNDDDVVTKTAAANALDADTIEALDFTIIAYNKFGGTVTHTLTLTATEAGTAVGGGVANDGTPDGQHFTMDLGSVNAPITRVLIVLKAGSVELSDPRAELDADGKRKAAGKNKEASIELHFVGATEGNVDDTTATGTTGPIPQGQPIVHKIARADGQLRPVTAATFDVLITLSEEPRKDGFKKDHIDAANATAGDPTFLDKIDAAAQDAATGMKSSGRDKMLYRYIVTLTPKYENKNDIVVKVKSFYDQEKQDPKMYMPPATPAAYTEGTDKLTVKVGKEVLKDKTAGVVVYIGEDIIIPKDGYLVVAKSKGDSAVRDPGDAKKSPAATVRQPFALTYNLVEGALPNLEVLLNNGGTIDVVGPKGLIVSEIMWGSDASLTAPVNSQYVELRNVSGAEIKAAKETYKLVFYGAGATLPDMSVAANNIQDRAGTVGANGYWSVAGTGQSGRTGIDESPGETVAVAPTQELVSMQRGYEAAALVAGVASEKGTVLIGTTVSVASDGTMMSSWTASEAPGVNFDPNKVGIRIGSPGREPVSYPTTPTPEPDPTPVAEVDDIAITEIMVDTSDGRLPQWIELTNVSGEEKSLAGWSLIVMNTAADDLAVGSRVTIDLSGTLGVGGGTDAGGTLGKSLLLVAWDGRNSRNLEGNARVVDVSDQVDKTGRYTLISETAFMLALMPPQKTSVVAYGDTAGNLGAAEAWEIPSSDGARSSLIRREMLADGMATMGTSANGWVLASSTSLVTGPATWYGSDEDAGTPGYDGGGPLPVELSHFRPARDKATGAVVITWSTQSELNNAGFFIKRSNQRDGQFEIINASMIPGAGTSSEKQFYTYTDTTAQPNVVYYYQIEDVSLDGNRQTLTRGIRLKGHIGAAGKLTTTWGDLKTQE